MGTWQACQTLKLHEIEVPNQLIKASKVCKQSPRSKAHQRGIGLPLKKPNMA